MTYRQKNYGGLLLFLLIIVVISYVSEKIPGTVLTPLIALLVVNLLFVEAGRYFLEGKPGKAKKRGLTVKGTMLSSFLQLSLIRWQFISCPFHP